MITGGVLNSLRRNINQNIRVRKMTAKNVPIIVMIVALLALSGCVGEQPEKVVKVETEELTPEEATENLSKIDLIESPLAPLDLPEMGLDIPSDFLDFNFMEKLDVSPEDFVKLEKPEINIDAVPSMGSADIETMMKAGATPPSGWEPDEETCAKFKLAPSCAFVPEEYRELCEKCREK